MRLIESLPVIAIVLVMALAQRYKVPGWILVVPVTFVLFVLYGINTFFFNEQKTGLVNRGISIVQ
jgi:hypothetical protein